MNCRITGLSSMATRHILADLARDYELRNGGKVDIRSMGGVEAAKLARAGEPMDIVVLASKVLESLEAEAISPEAASGISPGRRSRWPSPPARGDPASKTRQAVKQAMIEARRIWLLDGPERRSLQGFVREMGSAPTPSWRGRSKAPPGVPVATLVANGDADLGVQQLSELIGQPGVEVAGPLPPEIQAVTVFSAGVSTASADREAAQALVAYLASAATQAAKRRHGMEPA